MKALLATILIFLGGIWLFYATVVPVMMSTRAMSHVMQLEANLKRWASEKVSEGKLTEDDVREIFPENYSLRFGGENPNRSFREMVEHISRSSAPPIWPGVILVALGVIVAFRLPSTSKAKQGVDLSV
jgi:hypothetical protein